GTAVLSDTATLSGGFMVAAGNPAPTITFYLIAPNGSTVYTETQTVTGTGNYSTTGTGTGSELATQGGTHYWNVSYSGNTLNNSVTHYGQNDTNEQLIVTGGTPGLAITKTADQGTVTAGTKIGFTVTITNTGNASTTGVTLNDALPPGPGGDIYW